MLIAISSLARQLFTGAAGTGSSQEGLEGREVCVVSEHTALRRSEHEITVG